MPPATSWLPIATTIGISPPSPYGCNSTSTTPASHPICPPHSSCHLRTPGRRQARQTTGSTPPRLFIASTLFRSCIMSPPVTNRRCLGNVLASSGIGNTAHHGWPPTDGEDIVRVRLQAPKFHMVNEPFLVREGVAAARAMSSGCRGERKAAVQRIVGLCESESSQFTIIVEVGSSAKSGTPAAAWPSA